MKNKLELVLKTSIKQQILLNCIQYIGLNIEQTQKAIKLLEFATTPYYIDLIDNLFDVGKGDAAKRLLQSLTPNNIETDLFSQIEDGIGEDNTVEDYPILSRFFPNRVLISINNKCPHYCRYCFRRRRLGRKTKRISIDEIINAIDFIKNENAYSTRVGKQLIDEIILSGGEPLNLSQKTIEIIIGKILEIKELQTCRIDTKLLAVNPKVFSVQLVKLLAKLKTLYIVNHFIHPEEITELVKSKVNLLLKHGIITGAHIPILKGINDDYSIIKELVNKLYFSKVRPYYLIQFIPTKWTEHFRVPLEKSIEIRERLAEECSGFSIPSLVVYLPHGKGKAIINSYRDIEKVDGGYSLNNTLKEKVLYEEKI